MFNKLFIVSYPLLSDEPYFTRHPRPTVNIIITQELELICGAIADTTPTLTWVQRTDNNETTIISSPRFSITNENLTDLSVVTVLRIESVVASDAREYVCRASGSNNSVAESSSTVNVRGKQYIHLAQLVNMSTPL